MTKKLSSDQDVWMRHIKPYLDRLTKKINENPAASLTGFVYSDDPPMLIHFGNVDYPDDDTILHVHNAFAKMYMYSKQTSNVQYADGQKVPDDASLSLADQLALMLQIPNENNNPVHNQKLNELVLEYLKTRRKE
jgi:hypothetical protein